MYFPIYALPDFLKNENSRGFKKSPYFHGFGWSTEKYSNIFFLNSMTVHSATIVVDRHSNIIANGAHMNGYSLTWKFYARL